MTVVGFAWFGLIWFTVHLPLNQRFKAAIVSQLSREDEQGRGEDLRGVRARAARASYSG